MAILIEKNVSVMGEIPVSQLYIRFQYVLRPTGKHIRADAKVYFNKNSFKEDYEQNVLKVNELRGIFDIEYDSSKDGDILLFIHEKYKDMLLESEFCSEEDISFVDL